MGRQWREERPERLSQETGRVGTAQLAGPQERGEGLLEPSRHSRPGGPLVAPLSGGRRPHEPRPGHLHQYQPGLAQAEMGVKTAGDLLQQRLRWMAPPQPFLGGEPPLGEPFQPLAWAEPTDVGTNQKPCRFTPLLR